MLRAPFFKMGYNVGHMSIGGFRSDSLSTEAETIIDVLRLATHEPRHYLYAVLPAGFYLIIINITNEIKEIINQITLLL
jgi:hypothetical protein